MLRVLWCCCVCWPCVAHCLFGTLGLRVLGVLILQHTKAEHVHVLEGLALPRASPGSRRLHSSLTAAPALFAHAVVTAAKKTSSFISPNACVCAAQAFWVSSFHELNDRYSSHVTTQYPGHLIVFSQVVQLLVMLDFLYYYLKRCASHWTCADARGCCDLCRHRIVCLHALLLRCLGCLLPGLPLPLSTQKTECARAQKGLALPRTSHSSQAGVAACVPRLPQRQCSSHKLLSQTPNSSSFITPNLLLRTHSCCVFVVCAWQCANGRPCHSAHQRARRSVGTHTQPPVPISTEIVFKNASAVLFMHRRSQC